MTVTGAARSDAASIAAFMGLKNPNRFTDLALVDQIATGLPARAAKIIASRIDPAGDFLQATDLIPRATFHRKLKQREALSAEHSERLLSFARVLAEALRQYRGDQRAAHEFLRGPHPMLGGRSALKLALRSTAGADLVLRLLERAEAGVAV